MLVAGLMSLAAAFSSLGTGTVRAAELGADTVCADAGMHW